jgi:N-acyl-D-amino-acid deacylase
MDYDIIFKGGTLIDGTGSGRQVADVAIGEGQIVAIGPSIRASAKETVDAEGLIVAPGVIDLHTHYDSQLHWDPYCTNSGSHGTTTVVIGNCGFGFAPCRPSMQDRYMAMMERTEQIPATALRSALPWNWETFPEWIDHLRALPKGVNVATYFPLNPLMIYVMGVEDAKSRRPTEAEMQEMKRLLREGLDHGAIGFAFTWLGPVNNHVDVDGGPMPTDVMDIRDAYELAGVLKERGTGLIMCNCDINQPGLNHKREVAAELARISGQTVLHNIVNVVAGTNHHEQVLAWLDECLAGGLSVYSQGAFNRPVIQFAVSDYTSWDIRPILRDFTSATRDEKLRMVADPSYRTAVAKEHDPLRDSGYATAIHEFRLASAEGHERYRKYEGESIAQIAGDLGMSTVDTFFDILAETELNAEFVHLERGARDPAVVAPLMRHPRVVPGTSDGGAHVKFMSGGQYSTDFLTWLARDGEEVSLEMAHAHLSALPAAVLGLDDRGTLQVGKRADLIVYDLEELGFNYGRYEKVYDLPDGGWRRVAPVHGMRYVAVNGEVTMVDGMPTGKTPGDLISAVSSSTSA